MLQLSSQLVTPQLKITVTHTQRYMAIKQPSAPFANDMFLKNMFNERLFENYSLFSELQRETKGKLWLYKQLFAQIPLIGHPQGY